MKRFYLYIKVIIISKFFCSYNVFKTNTIEIYYSIICSYHYIFPIVCFKQLFFFWVFFYQRICFFQSHFTISRAFSFLRLLCFVTFCFDVIDFICCQERQYIILTIIIPIQQTLFEPNKNIPYHLFRKKLSFCNRTTIITPCIYVTMSITI